LVVPNTHLGLDEKELVLSLTLAMILTMTLEQGYLAAAEGWYSGGSFLNFQVISGSTSSTGTGPAAAASGSYYAYVESSSPNSPGYTFALWQDFGRTVNSITFNYHMYGAAMGSLQLQGSADSSCYSYDTLWTRSGNYGSVWNYAAVDFDSSDGYQCLRFVAVTGYSYTSDFALDSITTYFALSPTVEPTSGVELSCSFENDTCSFVNGELYNSWTSQSGSTPTASTGPSKAKKGNFYMFVEGDDYDPTASPNAKYDLTLDTRAYDDYGDWVGSIEFFTHRLPAYGRNDDSESVCPDLHLQYVRTESKHRVSGSSTCSRCRRWHPMTNIFITKTVNTQIRFGCRGQS